MASVWLAWAPRLGAWRAIKTLDAMGSASARSRFENEARAMARLRHPHVIAVHDVGVDDTDRPFLVMEYAPRGSLADVLHQRGPLPPRLACRLVREVLDGLEHAHAHGIVHRDIKPQNVLLDREGHALVADFGIARIDTLDQTRTGAAMGTLAWMAPEQRSSAREVDARADVYAAGGLLFALLVGREPLDLYVPDSDFDGVPEPLVEPIRGAVAWDRERRWPSARAFADVLVRAEEELPPDRDEYVLPEAPEPEAPPTSEVGATFADDLFDTAHSTQPTPEPPRPPTPPPPAAVPAPGGRWLAATVGAVLVVAGATTVWLASPDDGPPALSLEHLPVGDAELDGVDFSSDGSALYYVADGRLQRHTIGGERTALGPWTRDATFELAPADVVLRTNWWKASPLLRWDAGREEELPLVGRQARIAPAGDAVAFVVGNELRVAGWPDGPERVVATLPDQAVIYDLSWSTDGRFLTTADRDRQYAVHLWPLDGGVPVTLLEDPRLISSVTTIFAVWRDHELWFARSLGRSEVGLFALAVDEDGRPGAEREIHRWSDGTWPVIGSSSSRGEVALQTARRYREAWVGDHHLEAPSLLDARFLNDGRVAIGGPDGVVVGDGRGPWEPWSPAGATAVHPVVGAVLAEGFADAGQPRSLWRSTPDTSTELPPLKDRERLACARDTADRCVVATPMAAVFQLAWMDPRTGERGPVFGKVGIAREELGRIAVSPAGNHVAVFELTSDLVVVDVDGTTRRVPSGLAWIQSGAFSPDGRAVWAVGNTGEGWATAWIPLDGGPPEIVERRVDGLSPPDVGPAGERLAVVASFDVGVWLAHHPP